MVLPLSSCVKDGDLSVFARMSRACFICALKDYLLSARDATQMLPECVVLDLSSSTEGAGKD